MLGRLGTGGALAVAGALFFLNVAVDSVLYLVSVAVDAATIGGAGFLLWKRDRALKARHRAEVASLNARVAEMEAIGPQQALGAPRRFTRA